MSDRFCVLERSETALERYLAAVSAPRVGTSTPQRPYHYV